MESCSSTAALLLRVMAVAGAVGLASPASEALAQAGQAGNPAGASTGAKLANAPGVTVQAPPRTRIPPRKKAGLDAEAAQRKAWETYRATTPAPSPGSTAAAGVSASTRAENYPGLHTLPH